MFAKKLVLIAAAVALATGSVVATSESANIKVQVSTVHGHMQAAVRSHVHSVQQVNETASPGEEDSDDYYEVEEVDEEEDSGEEKDEDDEVDEASDEESTADDDEEDSEDNAIGADEEEASDDDDSVAAEEDESEDSEDVPPVKKFRKKSHHKKDACAAGQSPMSVEGVEGVFCVSGQSCVAEIKGACPGPQANLQYGAYCDRVKTGVMGCKPKTKEMWEAEQKQGGNTGGQCNGAGQSPMSVEGVEGIFCVSGQACVANIDGACPGPQAGLPYGSSCGIVKTGVKGCKPNAAPKKHHKKSQKKIRVVKKL